MTMCCGHPGSRCTCASTAQRLLLLCCAFCARGVAAAGGSSGWQAPEQLIAKDGGAVRQSRAMDVFSLGCVMYYCLTAGKHPFGEQYERDTNILRGLCNLAPLHKWPEATNLVRQAGWREGGRCVCCVSAADNCMLLLGRELMQLGVLALDVAAYGSRWCCLSSLFVEYAQSSPLLPPLSPGRMLPQVSAMLCKSPAARPTMAAVLGHPFWWSEEQRLQFLVDVSDRCG